MLILPAIDLLGGKVVRLVEGKRDQATVYSDSPGDVAAAFVEAGAHRIHVVDLDGAFAGRRENIAAVAAILATGVSVELGGGVRDTETCRRLLEEGVDLVVVGTMAARDPEAFAALDPDLLSQLVVAVDARDGLVFTEGWDRATGLDALALGRRMAAAGVAGVLYTDIARDGRGVGPNVEASARMAAALSPTPVIASGGIGSLDDLRALSRAGLPQAVVGRALYEGAFTLAEAMAAATATVRS